MLDEARVGTAMLTLQLRAAVQEAVQAEATFADRDSARDELRGRLAVLVDRRHTDMAAELVAERDAAERLVEAARQQAALIVEASELIENAKLTPVELVAPAALATGLTGRARGAQLALQLRTALREATAAERDEARAKDASEGRQRQAGAEELRRKELNDGLTRARVEAASVINAARDEAAALVSASENSHLEVAVDPVEEMSEFEVAEIADPVALLPDRTHIPAPTPAPPAAQAPVNVVIDAEAFARVFAAVFATMFDERNAARGGNFQPAMYPTQMYGATQFAVPQPAPAPVKQSFWSHAKHVDVLLLSAAMVIVLVVLAAWLV